MASDERSAIRKMPSPKLVEGFELEETLSSRFGIKRIDRSWRGPAEDKNLWNSRRPRRRQRILKFPLGPGYWRAPVNPAVFANSGFFRKRRAQARPQNQE